MTKRTRDDMMGLAQPCPQDNVHAEHLNGTGLGQQPRRRTRLQLPSEASRQGQGSAAPREGQGHPVDDPDAGPGPNNQQDAGSDEQDDSDDLLSQLQQAYLQQLPAQQQQEQRLAALLQGTYKSRMEAARSSTSCSSCGHAQLQQVYSVPLRIVDLTSSFALDVPVLSCCGPGCGSTTAIQSLQLSCWPSATSPSLDLTKAGPGEQQTWFTLQLMSHADRTAQLLPDAPVQRYSQLLQAHAAHCGWQVSVEELDLLLGPALLQYQRMRLRVGPAGQAEAALAAPAAPAASGEMPGGAPGVLPAGSPAEAHGTAADTEVDPPHPQHRQRSPLAPPGGGAASMVPPAPQAKQTVPPVPAVVQEAGSQGGSKGSRDSHQGSPRHRPMEAAGGAAGNSNQLLMPPTQAADQQPQQHQQVVDTSNKQRMPCCNSYQVTWLPRLDTGASMVSYVHVYDNTQQEPVGAASLDSAPLPEAVLPSAPAAAAAAAAAGDNSKRCLAVDDPQQQQEKGKVVELGAGGGGVVYLLEQQGPLNTAYPRQVALKVPFLGSTSSLVREYHVLTHLRSDLVNVVQLLGKAQGSCGGTQVTGLVYEYCPVSDMRDWASNLLLQAAQQPDVQEELEAAAGIVLEQAGILMGQPSAVVESRDGPPQRV